MTPNDQHCPRATLRLFPGPSGGVVAEYVPCEAQSTRRSSVGFLGCLLLLGRLLLLHLLVSAAAVVVALVAAAVATVAGVLAGWRRR